MRLPLIPAALGQSVIRFRHLVVRPLSPWQKVVYGLAAAILVLLGLIGIVLPVLPGLFFGADLTAVWLLVVSKAAGATIYAEAATAKKRLVWYLAGIIEVDSSSGC
jgi:hypothetical protein